MNFGMGLAGFVSGVQAGMDIRDRFDARKERRENKGKLAEIDSATKADYDAAVKKDAGAAGSYDDFWTKYALPKQVAELMRQGDYDRARKLKDWGETDEAKEGGRLFGSSLLKAQTGDAGGALDDAIKAAQVKGYMDSGYKLKSKDEIRDGDKLLGYRLTVTDGEGNEFQQDVRPEDVPLIVATFVNPEAAFKMQLDNQAAAEKKKSEEADRQTKRGEDLEDHRAKKQIDLEFEAPKAGADLEEFRAKESIKKEFAQDTPQEAYSKAFKTRLENDMAFATKSAEEQQAIVEQDLNAARSATAPGISVAPSQPGAPAQSGAPGMSTAPGMSMAPAQPAPAENSRLIIDTATGKPVEPKRPAAAAPSAAPGMNQPVSPNPKQQAIDSAIAEIKSGADPASVRKKLSDIGISDAEFTADVKARAKRLPAG